jgi:threonyl-tRNA synthetase
MAQVANNYSDDMVHRLAKWDEFMAAPRDAIPQVPIKVTFADKQVVDAVAGKDSPMSLLKQHFPKLAKDVVVADVDGKKWDLLRPLEGDATVTYFDFTTDEGKHVFWHSSAHILGQAIELVYPGCHLTIGPALEDGGFYYDCQLPNGQVVVTDDIPKIQDMVNKIIKDKQSFTRLVLSPAQALSMFSGNKFKEEIIKRIPEQESTTCYRNGPLVDLCRGPHVFNTGKVAAMRVTRTSSAYWMGDNTKDSLQRIYGISFPSKAELEEYEHLLAEAEKRDHRRLGTQQQLFFFHPLSPGSAFFLPHGTRLYNKLVDFIRGEYRKRGYDEVVSPNMFNVDLWKQSGHYQNYRENMFSFQVEGQEFALKPMNCPGHCLLFNHRKRSYRELPLRIADFGVLHRNELSGALTGLTRVRRFQQDDAHIFCRRDQIESEISGVLDMLQHVYGIFGYTFALNLSTRPEKYLGEVQLWDEAELGLTKALDNFCNANPGNAWAINPGDGAFYGPKIDIQIMDALKRKWQLATIQLDYQLPIRFGLQYRSSQEVIGTGQTEILPGDVEAFQAQHTSSGAVKHNKTIEPELPVENPETVQAALNAPLPSCCDDHHDEVADDKNADSKEVIPSYLELSKGYERPVMIHRAILGSVERMIAVLIEHTGGKWPFWLNPRQVIVVPLSPDQWDYADEVRQEIHDAGFYCDVSSQGSTYKKAILDAHNDGYSLTLVVGRKEQDKHSANVRFSVKEQVEMPVADVIAMCRKLEQDKAQVIVPPSQQKQ